VPSSLQTQETDDEIFIPGQLSQARFVKTFSETRRATINRGNKPGVSQSPPVGGRLRLLRSPPQVDAEDLSLNHGRSDMKQFLTTPAVFTAFATPEFALARQGAELARLIVCVQ
jgi:hypothetical protein